MRRTKSSPEVNAGSMADIAFLLLLFFLITAAIPKDKGIYRKLPSECPPGIDCKTDIPEKNILEIAVNANNEVMIEEEIVNTSNIKNLVKAFLDNNADGSCLYCNGKRDEASSDNPLKAVISLQTDRNSNYNTFIRLQDEITKAYFELRKAYCESILKKPIDNLTEKELQQVKGAYPLIISEAETKRR